MIRFVRILSPKTKKFREFLAKKELQLRNFIFTVGVFSFDLTLKGCAVFLVDTERYHKKESSIRKACLMTFLRKLHALKVSMIWQGFIIFLRYATSIRVFPEFSVFHVRI